MQIHIDQLKTNKSGREDFVLSIYVRIEHTFKFQKIDERKMF